MGTQQTGVSKGLPLFKLGLLNSGYIESKNARIAGAWRGGLRVDGVRQVVRPWETDWITEKYVRRFFFFFRTIGSEGEISGLCV